MDQLRNFFGNLSLQVGGFFSRLTPSTNLCQNTVPVASSLPTFSESNVTDLSGANVSADISGANVSVDLSTSNVSADLSTSNVSADLSGSNVSVDLSGSNVSADLSVKTGVLEEITCNDGCDISFEETVKANCALPCSNSASCLCSGDESAMANVVVTAVVSLPVVKLVDEDPVKSVGLKLLIPENKVD